MNDPKTFPGTICISLEHSIICEVLICGAFDDTVYIFVGRGRIAIVAGYAFGYTLRDHAYIELEE